MWFWAATDSSKIWGNCPLRRKGEMEGKGSRDVVLGGNHPCHSFFLLIFIKCLRRESEGVEVGARNAVLGGNFKFSH